MKPFIFLKPNQCPECMGILTYKEIEIFEAPLDEHGVPIEGKFYAEPRLVCSTCKKVFDCERKGLGFTINYHLPKVIPVKKDFNPFYN